MRTAILSDTAPKPIGPYNQAIAAGSFVFCSGQIGLDPATATLVEGGVEQQARQCMKNLAAVLEAAGTTLGEIVKTTIFLVDMADFTLVNRIYGEYFNDTPPARSTVAVAALPAGALVEIDAIARV
jgi:2-iminobutanoate/2-iminopropanoate deaminase